MKYICQSCGAPIEEITEGIGYCNYCGVKQTFPISDDDKVINTFNRANTYMKEMDFDAAKRAFESIFTYLPNNIQANWGILLCKYGVQYTKDPSTNKMVITCAKALNQSIFGQPEYREILKNASPEQAEYFSETAIQINKLQQKIINSSNVDNSFDIFISYKETDNNNERTIDSIKALDLYNELTKKGYRVFFSRVTLQNYIGSQYEPIIFSALNSARLMVLIGTSAENFNSPWVKNEWSRFYSMMSSDKKKSIVVCFESASDIPQVLRGIQSVSLQTLGWYQDIAIYADKFIQKNIKPVVGNSQKQGSVLRGYELIANKEWMSAKKHFEELLNETPNNEQVILGYILSKYETTSIDALHNHKTLFNLNNDSTLNILLNSCSPMTKNKIRKQQLLSQRTELQQQIINKPKSSLAPSIVAHAILIVGFIIYWAISINNEKNAAIGFFLLFLFNEISFIILYKAYNFFNKHWFWGSFVCFISFGTITYVASIAYIIKSIVDTVRFKKYSEQNNEKLQTQINKINDQIYECDNYYN